MARPDKRVWQEGEVRGGGNLIFTTVGTHQQSFDRLVKSMDELAQELEEEVIIQIGYSNYIPKHSNWFRFEKDEEKFLGFYCKADVVVAHAGAGTLMTVLLLQKPLVAVPRLRKHGEHVDDQQVQLAEALANTGNAVSVLDTRDLKGAIERVRSKGNIYKADNTALVGYLRETLVRMVD